MNQKALARSIVGSNAASLISWKLIVVTPRLFYVIDLNHAIGRDAALCEYSFLCHTQDQGGAPTSWAYRTKIYAEDLEQCQSCARFSNGIDILMFHDSRRLRQFSSWFIWGCKSRSLCPVAPKSRFYPHTIPEQAGSPVLSPRSTSHKVFADFAPHGNNTTMFSLSSAESAERRVDHA